MGKLMRILNCCVLIVFVATLASCEKRGADEANTLAVRADNVILYEQKRANMSKMKEFLWNHWLQRRPATLLLTSVTKEGSKYRFGIQNHHSSRQYSSTQRSDHSRSDWCPRPSDPQARG